MFLKIGAWPNAYIKKVDDRRVMAILETLLTFKLETFVNAEFIYSLTYVFIIAGKIKYSANIITKDYFYQ